MVFGLFSKDESDGWKQVVTENLTLDLGNLAINGVALGDAPGKIEAFGKPDNKKPFKNGKFEYVESGLIVEVYDGNVGYFGMCINPDQHTPVSPVELDVHHGELRLRIVKTTMRTEFMDLFGLEPRETDPEGGEIVDFIDLQDATLEIESYTDGRIKRVNLYVD